MDFATFFKQEVQRHVAELSAYTDAQIALELHKYTLPAEFHTDYTSLLKKAGTRDTAYNDLTHAFSYWQGALPDDLFDLYGAKLGLVYVQITADLHLSR